MRLKVIIAGPRGKMGSKVYKMLEQNAEIDVVALLDYKQEKWKDTKIDIPVYSNAQKCFNETDANLLVDFTTSEASFAYIKKAMKAKIKVISGTTGFNNEELSEIATISNRFEVGCVIAPNFALGAVFMMIFSQYAAKYFNTINIIERHHEHKFDVPSGTAHTIGELIQESNPNIKPEIHSLRMPGYIAHHEVILGGPGQILTIKHDSHNRESFLDGLMLAIQEIDEINSYVFGLENVLRL